MSRRVLDLVRGGGGGFVHRRPGSLLLGILLICASLLSTAEGATSGGGGAGTTPTSFKTPASRTTPIRVAYQGEPGAYSEKSLRELLGDNVVAVGRQNFEDCYRAVASRECDYCCLPVENSLGGSIHENYDLMLRYDLT